MKLALTLKYLLYLLLIITSFSCEKDDSQKKLLEKAQDSLIIGKPDMALNLLSSIQHPERMDKDSYMQYIVTHVGAKYETKADIINDTLIFEAQRYFIEKGNPEESALANYYAAQVYDESGNHPKALESYLLTFYEANKSQNHLLAAKSLNNIGYIYFEKDIFDSAVINYQKALNHYDKVENIDKNKLRVLINLGRTYEADNKLDSAYLYFQEGLSLAKKTESKLEESQLYQNLGAVCYGKGENEQALEYFQSALNIGITNKTQIQKIHLTLLNIYNKKQDPKSAKEYADLVIASLPEVTYIYTLKEMYAALAEYYKQLGDYKQALNYSELERSTKDQIEKEANAPALLQADKNFHLAQKEREAAQLRTHLYLYLSIVAIVIFIVLLFLLFLWKEHKKNKEEIKLHTEKYEIIKGMLHSMNQRYPHIEAEIKSMLEDNEEDKK